MEEVDTITVAVSGIDINKVEPLDTRRLVTFINHYLATTVSFLNHFATQCESKLDRMQQQLHRVECRLKLLECKLASIPGIPSTPEATAAAAAAASGSKTQQPATASTSTDSLPVPGPSGNSSNSEGPSTLSNLKTSEINHSGEEGSTSGGNGVSESNHSEEEESKGGSGTSSVRDDPRYVKYFKMVTVGVPVQAVKQKMASEGVDPSVLDL